jgi:RNA polymerase sigma factor (sigma-70 family)
LIAQLRASSTTPSRALSRKEAVALLQIALARLPEAQRTIIRLRFFEDVPVTEIAQRLGKGEMAVYQAIHRGLKRLGGMMEQ